MAPLISARVCLELCLPCINNYTRWTEEHALLLATCGTASWLMEHRAGEIADYSSPARHGPSPIGPSPIHRSHQQLIAWHACLRSD